MQPYMYVIIGVAVFIVAFVAFVASRSESFSVERTGLVNAPAAVPFSLVNNLHEWKKWSPFEKFDPDMKKTFEGPPSGPGAVSTWSGNKRAGEGKITVLETQPNQLVSIKLEFLRPFKATNGSTFRFVPETNATRVTWTITGKKNFVMKAMHLFMDMDKLIGKDFEEGLAKLNTVSQSEDQKTS